MKIVLFLLVVTTCHSDSIDKKSLSYPHSVKIKINDEPQSFDISWKKVETVDEENPVLGYKVKILELKRLKKIKRIVNKFDRENNETRTVEVEEYLKLRDYRNVMDGNLTELIVAAVDQPTVRFEGWKLETVYEIRVLGFTKIEEGPSSSPNRFKINDDNE